MLVTLVVIVMMKSAYAGLDPGSKQFGDQPKAEAPAEAPKDSNAQESPISPPALAPSLALPPSSAPAPAPESLERPTSPPKPPESEGAPLQGTPFPSAPNPNPSLNPNANLNPPPDQIPVQTRPQENVEFRKPKGIVTREKDAEGTQAPKRLDQDLIIKSKYQLNGQSLEVDTD